LGSELLSADKKAIMKLRSLSKKFKILEYKFDVTNGNSPMPIPINITESSGDEFSSQIDSD
jgi:hypothetical protein